MNSHSILRAAGALVFDAGVEGPPGRSVADAGDDAAERRHLALANAGARFFLLLTPFGAEGVRASLRSITLLIGRSRGRRRVAVTASSSACVASAWRRVAEIPAATAARRPAAIACRGSAATAAAVFGSVIFGKSRRGKNRHHRQNTRKDGEGLLHVAIIGLDG